MSPVVGWTVKEHKPVVLGRFKVFRMMLLIAKRVVSFSLHDQPTSTINRQE
jgi:hypothetical protein